MGTDQFLAGHPRPREGAIYHDGLHSRNAYRLAFTLAKGRNLDEAQAGFIAEVALLHDWDPDRQAGTPARVPSTLSALWLDFHERRPLIELFEGSSVLKERFGWTRRQLLMARAMIQRTEYPFGDRHRNPAYRKASPIERYRRMLTQLDPADRAFVLREAPLLAEYADKASWYAMHAFAKVAQVTEGLANEMAASSSHGDTTAKDVLTGTPEFIRRVGGRQAFKIDRQLAREFGIRLTAADLPPPARVFELMPRRYGDTFAANLAGFSAMARSLEAGEPLRTAVRAGARVAREHRRDATCRD